MAHVQRRDRDGTTTYLARWTTPDGKDHVRGGFATRKRAQSYLDVEVVPKLARGVSFDPAAGGIAFRDAAAAWLESRHDLKESTRAAYTTALAPTTTGTAKRHKRLANLRIDAVFGGYPLNRITREQISEWVARMQTAGKTPSTIRNAYFLVRQILGQAVADGRLDSNPADYVKLPTEHNTGTGTVVDDPSMFLTPAQVAALVDATPWPMNILVHLGAWAGPRPGELAGLQVGDVELPDLPNRPGTLRIDRTLARVGSELKYLTPKTKGSRRRVPLTPQTVEILRDYLTMHPRRHEPSAPLFPSVRLTTPKSTGKRTGPKNLTAAQRAERQLAALAALTVDEAEARLVLDWKQPLRHATYSKAVFAPAVLRANRMHPSAALSPATHPHGMRHTYISLCVAAGLPMFEISRFAGHARPSTTESVYAHLLREDHTSAMAALGATGAPTASNVVPLRAK